TLLEALGGKERGELRRQPAEETRGVLGGRSPPDGLLLTLDPLPLGEEIAAGDLGPGEDVGVPADELLVEAPGDLAGIERALLAGELGMDGDLEQEVAELVAQPLEIAGVERGERLIRFLEQVGAQRRVRLLAVPGTAMWRAQTLGDARDRRKRGEIREGILRVEHEPARAAGIDVGEGRPRLALADDRHRVRRRIPRAQERE